MQFPTAQTQQTTNGKRSTAYNSTYPKVAVRWLNQALYFNKGLCLADSEVLQNRHLRVAAFQDQKQDVGGNFKGQQNI
jgi:hypothetical protein